MGKGFCCCCCFSMSQILHGSYIFILKKLFTIYLKFSFNRAFFIVPGHPMAQSPTKLPSISGSPQVVRHVYLAVDTIIASARIPITIMLSITENGKLSSGWVPVTESTGLALIPCSSKNKDSSCLWMGNKVFQIFTELPSLTGSSYRGNTILA